MAEPPKPRKASEESVKLFVGQVPKHMTETQLLVMFKEFALVDEVNIIKDKATRASRGFRQPYALAKSRLLSVSSNYSRIFDFHTVYFFSRSRMRDSCSFFDLVSDLSAMNVSGGV